MCLVESDVPSRVKGDAARIRQVLTNLMVNAVKFTEKGEVTLLVQLVSKTEPRHRPHQRPRHRNRSIPRGTGEDFRELHPGRRDHDSKVWRHGIGVTISKQLTELMGGKIGVESQVGVGSTFYVELSLPRQLGVSEASEEPSPVIMDGLHVLVVDDNATNRRVLMEQLKSWRCLPAEAESAKDALALLSSSALAGSPFRVAILDMQMPEINGEELGSMIRDDARFENMAMILYTSIGQHASALQLRDLGLALVLAKPVRQSQLFEAVLSVLGGRHQEPSGGKVSFRKTRPPLPSKFSWPRTTRSTK